MHHKYLLLRQHHNMTWIFNFRFSKLAKQDSAANCIQSTLIKKIMHWHSTVWLNAHLSISLSVRKWFPLYIAIRALFGLWSITSHFLLLTPRSEFNLWANKRFCVNFHFVSRKIKKKKSLQTHSWMGRKILSKSQLFSLLLLVLITDSYI